MTDDTTDDPAGTAGDAQDDAGAQDAQQDQDDTVDPSGDADDDQGDKGTDPAARASREAARYRTQLRETQAERDALAQRIDAMQRREVQRLASDRLAQPDDLLVFGGAALADLLDDDGNVNAEAVQATVDNLLEDRPGLGKVAPIPRGPSASGLGSHGSHGGSETTWGEVLSRR